jgi:hypothetical protein
LRGVVNSETSRRDSQGVRSGHRIVFSIIVLHCAVGEFSCRRVERVRINLLKIRNLQLPNNFMFTIIIIAAELTIIYKMIVILKQSGINRLTPWNRK